MCIRDRGYTYFKLRDLADALGFSVAWDDAANKISVTTADVSGQTPIAPGVYQDMLGHGMEDVYKRQRLRQVRNSGQNQR